MSHSIQPAAVPRRRILSRLAVATTTAAALAACGGGGSSNGALAFFSPGSTTASTPAPSDPSSAPASSPSAADASKQDQSSTPCVNEADYRPGTVVEFSAATSAPVTGRAPFQRKAVTGPRESFANVTPVPFTTASSVQTVDSTLPGSTLKSTTRATELRKEYRDLVAGNVVIYGEFQSSESMVTYTSTASDPSSPSVAFEPNFGSNSRTRTFDPALTFPITMQPGATVTQRATRVDDLLYRFGNTTMKPASESISALFSLTYYGRERITTSLGTFDSCRFTLQTTIARATGSVQTTQDHWVAAEGPYRGQMLRLKKNGAVWDVTTLNYSPS